MQLPHFYPIPRFYPILDTGVCERHAIDPVEAASEILEGGAHILQFRHKALFTRQAFEWVQTIAGMAKYAGIPFVVNDRADVARLFGAWLHVGQEDLPPKAVRSIIGPDAVLGYSTHNEAQLRVAASEPVNYLALGPIFGTATKENPDPVVGLEALLRLRPLTERPLVAIGGITRENAGEVLEAGADSVAVIGDLFAKGDLRAGVAEWIRVTG